MQLVNIDSDGHLVVWGRVIGVLASPDSDGATCIVEAAESRTPLLCEMIEGDREMYEAMVGQMVTVVGKPWYSNHGRVFKVARARIKVGRENE
jgi:hypothetical protein